MQKQSPPPVRTPMYDQKGIMNHVWAKWFEEVGKRYDDYRRTPDRVFTSSDGTLYTADYGKTIRFDNGDSTVNCYLPAITAQDIHCWILIFRSGFGRLSIRPAAGDIIETSTSGGVLFCNEKNRYGANVTLEVMKLNTWAITGSTGIWKLR